jgi:tripartite-type tricarboxylate transporter receptor subunit TctC
VNYAAPSVIVKSDSPYTTLDQLLADAKENPSKIRFGHSGNWGAFMVPGAIMFAKAGAKVSMIPHKGGGPALQALLAGDIDVTMAYRSVIEGQNGGVRPIATISPVTDIPGVPTTGELGLDGLADIGLMHRVVMAPAGTPDDVLAKLGDAFKKMSADPTYISLMEKLGENAEYMSAAEYQPIRLEQAENYKELVARFTQK